MAEQYKNPFEDPEAELWGEKIKDYKIPKRKEAPLEEKVTNLEGFIYVPSIKLYVAKERSLLGKNWYQAHEELHRQGLQMLTIRQFVDFILYLKQNKSNIPEAERILGEILTPREPYRFGGEWLDARFSSEGARSRGLYVIKEAEGDIGYDRIQPSAKPKGGFDKSGDIGYPGTGPSTRPVDPFGRGIGRGFSEKAELYIHYNHRPVNGELVAQNIEPLEKCLMGDNSVVNCYFNLKDCNKQGLPTKIGNEIKHYSPEEGHVAAFWADRDGGMEKAVLDCGNYKSITSTSLGVRAARKSKSK